MQARHILTPDQRLRVFVSSTMQELQEERAAAMAAIKALRLSPVLFELGARPHPPQDVYQAYLGQSDIFIGIYWQSYGWVGPGMTISGIEDEFLRSQGMPRLIYVKTPAPDREQRLIDLLDSISKSPDVSYKHFATATELGRLVKDDLALLLTERFAGTASGKDQRSLPALEMQQPITTATAGPIVAVLPFSNLGGQAEYEYLVDGLVDGIITALQRFRWLTVIARNSTFAYKDRSEDLRRVGRELGARYLLEGSVQVIGQRVRIHGQLIDSASGAHVWADHFDGTTDDVFELEDRVTENVVAALEPQLRKAEIERARRKRPDSLDAYDLFLRALPHAYAMTPEDNTEAIGLLEEAMRLDPGFARARAFAAWCYEERLTRRWPEARDDDAQRAVTLAQMVLAADTDDATVIATAGFVLIMVGRRYEIGLEALRHAVELNPNSALVLMNAGWAEAFAGDVSVARAYLERARLLNPRDPEAFYVLTGLAFLQVLSGDCEEAVTLATKAAAVHDAWDATYFVLGLALACAGRVDEGRTAISRLIELWPGASISQYRKVLPIRDEGRRLALERCMRLAGLPE